MPSKKPELLVTAGSMNELVRYIDAGADAVNIGERRFGLRLPGDFSLANIAEAVEIAHGRGVKVYVSVNNIMNNDVLSHIPDYLEQLQKLKADAVVFGDPAVLMAARSAAPNVALHWNAEMTSTNYVTANYWATKGAVRAVLARELNLEQILETKRKVSMDIQVQVHGMTNIYHSKRNLVQSYMDHLGNQAEEDQNGMQRGMYLVETERQEEKYPVYEDANGTHIMSSEDICLLDVLDELMAGGVNSLKIEGLMKSPDYVEAAVRAYRRCIDAYAADPDAYAFNPQWLEPIKRLQPEGRELAYGFLFKEQVY